MKKTMIAVLLLCMLLANLPGCETKPTPSNTDPSAHQSDDPFADTTEMTESATPGLLTHVFREEEISLPEGFTTSQYVTPAYQNGRIWLYGTRSKQTDDGFATEHCLYEYQPEAGEGTCVSMFTDSLYANGGVVYGDKVYLHSSRRNAETGTTDIILHVYDRTKGELTTADNLHTHFASEPNSYPRIEHMAVDKDGYVYLVYEEKLYILTPTLALHGILTDIGYAGGLCTDENGVVCLLGNSGVKTIDREELVMKETAGIPEALLGADMTLGEGYALYGMTDVGLFGVMGEETTLLANWENSNVNATHIDTLQVLTPTTLLIYTNDKWCMLHKAEDIDVSTITVVKLAYVSNGGLGSQEEQQLREHVINYNRQNPDRRILTTDYAVYNTRENPTGGTDRLLLDMTTGVISPDLVFGLGEDTIITTLIEEDKAADLYTCMSSEMAADLVGGVKHTYERQGKLTAIPADFQVKTLLAPESIVGDRTDWTLEEMLAIEESLPEGTHLMTRETAEAWLNSGMAYASFVDGKAGTCHFDSPTFEKLLGYINSLPDVTEKSENVYEPYQTGQTILYECRYRSIMDYQKDPVVYNGEEYVRIGYPDVGQILYGRGSIVADTSAAVYLIPQEAQDREAAWDFIAFVLSCEPEMDIMTSGNIRSLRSQNRKAREVFSPYTSFYMYNGRYSRWLGDRKTPDENGRIDGQPGILVPWSEEAFDSFQTWLDEAETKTTAPLPSEILSIIREEVSVYVSDNRSAADTAEIIQSRVSLWLAERG